MRGSLLGLQIAVATVATTMMYSSVASATVAPAPSIAGSWTGPFVGRTFTFEFKQESSGWTGRYQSDRAKKWFNLHDIEVTDGAVRFSVISQPPSVYKLKLDPSGKSLTGSVQIGEYPVIPLDLSRTP